MDIRHVAEFAINAIGGPQGAQATEDVFAAILDQELSRPQSAASRRQSKDSAERADDPVPAVRPLKETKSHQVLADRADPGAGEGRSVHQDCGLPTQRDSVALAPSGGDAEHLESPTTDAEHHLNHAPSYDDAETMGTVAPGAEMNQDAPLPDTQVFPSLSTGQGSPSAANSPPTEIDNALAELAIGEAVPNLPAKPIAGDRSSPPIFEETEVEPQNSAGELATAFAAAGADPTAGATAEMALVAANLIQAQDSPDQAINAQPQTDAGVEATGNPATHAANSSAATLASLVPPPVAAAMPKVRNVSQPASQRPAIQDRPAPAPRNPAHNKEQAPPATAQPAGSIGAPTTPTTFMATSATESATNWWDDGSYDAFRSGPMPGWSVHLTQVSPARRQEFLLTLKQQLKSLPTHEQIAVQMQRAARDGIERITIQLSPAELGRIHVRMEIDEDKRVAASVVVERSTTLDLLQRDAKQLERALQEAGLKLDANGMSFNLAREEKETGDRRNGSGATGQDTLRADKSQPSAEPDAPADILDTASGLLNMQV